MQSFLKQVPLLILATAILALVTILGYTGNMDAQTTFKTIMGLSVAVGVISVAILVTATPNITLIAHLVFTLELIAAVLVLRLHHVIGADDVGVFIVAFIGAGVAAAPANAVTPSVTAPAASVTSDLQAALDALGTPVAPVTVPAPPAAP